MASSERSGVVRAASGPRPRRWGDRPAGVARPGGGCLASGRSSRRRRSVKSLSSDPVRAKDCVSTAVGGVRLLHSASVSADSLGMSTVSLPSEGSADYPPVVSASRSSELTVRARAARMSARARSPSPTATSTARIASSATTTSKPSRPVRPRLPVDHRHAGLGRPRPRVPWMADTRRARTYVCEPAVLSDRLGYCS